MINISLRDLIQAVPTLQKISSANFKGAMSFRIGRLIRELDKELILFEEAREKIARKYAKKDENGNPVIKDNNIEIDNVEECNKELQALLDTMIEIHVSKLPLEAFENVELSPTQAGTLEAIIEEDE